MFNFNNKVRYITLTSLGIVTIAITALSFWLVSDHRLNLFSALFLIILILSLIVKIRPYVFLVIAIILLFILPFFIKQVWVNNLANYIFFLISLYLVNVYFEKSGIVDYRLDSKNSKKLLFNLLKKILYTPYRQLALIAVIWLITSLLLRIFTTTSFGTVLLLSMLLSLLFVKLPTKPLFLVTIILLTAAVPIKLLGVSLLAQKIVIISYLIVLAAVWLALKDQIFRKVKLPTLNLIKIKNLIFFSLLCLTFIGLMLFMPILTKEGLMENGDLSTALNNNDYNWQHFFYLWQDSGSFSRMGGNSAAQFWFYLLFALIKSLTNLSISALVKLTIILPSIFALLSAYFLTKKILSDEKSGITNNRVSALTIESLSITSALFFVFNPWALARIVHLSHYYAYSLVPITLLALNRSLSKPRLINLLITAILINFIAWSPHFLVYLLLIIIIFCFCQYKNFSLLAKTIPKLALITIFIASYWLWPYLKISKSEGRLLEPGYIVKQVDIKPAGYSLAQYLSLNSRLPRNPQVIWTWRYFVTFLVLSLPITIIFSRQNRLVKTIALTGGLVSAFYIIITKYPSFYFWLMFDSPLASFAWLWREPYRPAGLLAFSYSFSFTFVLYKLVKNWQRGNYFLIACVLLLVLIISLI